MADVTPNIDISIDDVITAYGDHYINEGQNMSNLHMLPFEPNGTREIGTLIETDQTVLREANVEVQEVLQAYQDDFTSKGGVTFKPVMIPLFNMKVDIAIIPQKLRQSWLGFLTTNSRTPEDYPFVAWLIESYVKAQIDEDLELKAIYTGVQASPTPGTAGAATAVMNGLEKLINDLVGSGDLTSDNIFTGTVSNPTALTAKEFVTAIEDQVIKAIPEKYRYNYSMTLNMSRANRDKFRQGMRDKYNMNYQQADALTQVMDFENFTIKGLASMTGKKRIWTTPTFNLLMPTKGFSNKEGFELQKFGRYLKLLTDWWFGAGFVQPQLIFTTDAEVPDSNS